MNTINNASHMRRQSWGTICFRIKPYSRCLDTNFQRMFLQVKPKNNYACVQVMKSKIYLCLFDLCLIDRIPQLELSRRVKRASLVVVGFFVAIQRIVQLGMRQRNGPTIQLYPLFPPLSSVFLKIPLYMEIRNPGFFSPPKNE